MNRRVFGRGRLIVTVAGLLILLACVLPWGRTAGIGLPPVTTGAFDGAGVLVFAAAIGLLVLVVLPFAAGDHPVALDRPASFLLLLLVGIVAFGVHALQTAERGVLGTPDRSPGLWLAGFGLLVAASGVATLFGERREI